MGLRTKNGINKKRAEQILGTSIFNFIEQKKILTLQKEGLLVEDESSITSTDKGKLVLNKIIEYIL